MAAGEPAQKRARAGAEERKARVAVVGAGWWSQAAHLPQLRNNSDIATITAIVEPCPHPRSTLKQDMKSTKELSEHYGVPVFASVGEFLQSDAAKATDGVVVASNHASHHDNAVQAMKAGMHVLMEKPMTTDLQQAHSLVAAVKDFDKVFMVNNSANFREQAKRARDLIHAGEIGVIKHVRCYMGCALLWLFDNPDNVGWNKPSGSMLGNGFGWGQMSHVLAWVFMVTGLVPKSVYCEMVHSEKTGADLYDSGIVRCTNGATILMEGCASLPFVSYDKSPKQVDNKIFGTEGVLMYSGDDFDPSSGDLLLRRHDGNHKTFEGFHFEEYPTDAETKGPQSLLTFLAAVRGLPYFNGADVQAEFNA